MMTVSVLSVEPWGLKRQRKQHHVAECASFSALGRAVGFEAQCLIKSESERNQVSVLSVEPWGLKPHREQTRLPPCVSFSALGRAVGFEAVGR